MTVTINPYDRTAVDFDFIGYMVKLGGQLDQLEPELPKGTKPLDVPEVRRKLTKHDPVLFAVLYFPSLLEVDPTKPADVEGNIIITDRDREIASTAASYWRADPPHIFHNDGCRAEIDTAGRPQWRKILPAWASGHGHLDFLIASFLIGADHNDWHSAMVNSLIRTDYPFMWHERKGTRRGRAEFYDKKRSRS